MSELPIVEVSITGNAQTAQVAGFGTGLILAKNAVDPGIAVYQSAAEVATAGYAVKSPVYRMVQAYFSQVPRPQRVKVAALASALVWSCRVGVAILPPALSVVSVSFVLPNGTTRTATFTTSALDTLSTIAAGLGAAVSAFAELSVTIPVGDTYFNVQAAAGTTRIQVSAFSVGLSYLDTEADSGYSARLSELALLDPDFYGVAIDSTSAANVAAVFAWTQANKRVFFGLTQDTIERDTVGGGPLAVALRDSGYDCGELRFSGSGARSDAAMMGIVLAASWDDGTAPTWAFRELKGIPVDNLTPLQISNLQTAVHVSIYVQNRGTNITWEGKTPSGKFGDLGVFLAWLDARIGESVYNLLVREPRLGYTTKGIGKAGDAVWEVIRTAFAREAISPDFPITFTLPKPTDATTEERAERTLGGGGIRFGFVFAGAIHKVQVNGVVTL